MKKQIEVVGAIIFNDDKVLCAQRNENMSLPLMWEFPGGKIEKGESEIEALKQRMSEEMLCDLEVGDKVTSTSYEYDFGIVNLHTYKCKLKERMPTLTEHKSIQWLDVKDLETLEWAPADIPAVKIIVDEV